MHSEHAPSGREEVGGTEDQYSLARGIASEKLMLLEVPAN